MSEVNRSQTTQKVVAEVTPKATATPKAIAVVTVVATPKAIAAPKAIAVVTVVATAVVKIRGPVPKKSGPPIRRDLAPRKTR